jgi:putative hydrolase of the HAD superfamily
MVQYILFDLDNTLYPKSMGIFEQVVERIRSYMEVRMGYEKDLARELRLEYIRKYGSTLRGLMIHQNIDPEDYLQYVHDVGVEERLSPNPALAHLLQSIPCGKAIFTSGHLPHAQRVLHCLGVKDFFPQIFDIVFTRYIPKPNPEPYHQVIECIGVDPRECMMIEDLPANLKPAKDLGMTTVLVGEPPGGINGFVDYEIRDILELKKVLELIS